MKVDFTSNNFDINVKNHKETMDLINDKSNYNSNSSDTAFECFRLIIECKNISSQNINSLLNARMRDDMHIIDVCAANSIANDKFIDYLIKNNGTQGWKIDYGTTNTLRLTCLVGNYAIMTRLLNSTKNVASLVSEDEVTPSILQREWNIEHLRFGLTSFNMNDFAAINNFKMICNDNCHQIKIQNLLYWCINCKREIIVNSNSSDD